MNLNCTKKNKPTITDNKKSIPSTLAKGTDGSIFERRRERLCLFNFASWGAKSINEHFLLHRLSWWGCPSGTIACSICIALCWDRTFVALLCRLARTLRTLSIACVSNCHHNFTEARKEWSKEHGQKKVAQTTQIQWTNNIKRPKALEQPHADLDSDECRQ